MRSAPKPKPVSQPKKTPAFNPRPQKAITKANERISSGTKSTKPQQKPQSSERVRARKPENYDFGVKSIVQQKQRAKGKPPSAMRMSGRLMQRPFHRPNRAKHFETKTFRPFNSDVESQNRGNGRQSERHIKAEELVRPQRYATNSLGSNGFQCKTEGFFRHPNDCSKFYRCDRSPVMRRHEFNCPTGLHFDPSRSICNWPSMVSPKCSTAPNSLTNTLPQNLQKNNFYVNNGINDWPQESRTAPIQTYSHSTLMDNKRSGVRPQLNNYWNRNVSGYF